MQHVHLIQRQQIDVLLDLFHSEEVSGDVQHGAAPGEPRVIDDILRRDLPGAALAAHIGFDILWQQLPDRLNPVKKSGGAIGDETHRVGGDGQRVAFLTE